MRSRLSVLGLGVLLALGTVQAYQTLRGTETTTPGTVQVLQGMDLAPSSPSTEALSIPLGTEIPWDSLRKLQRLPAPAGGHEDVPGTRAAPPVVQEFSAIPYTGWRPADPDLAVGPQDLVVVVNNVLRVYDKTGTQLYSNTLNDFFASHNPPSLVFDPRVVFDPLDRRFVLVALALNSSSQESYILLAVSDDSTAIGTWETHMLNSNGNNTWADFPGLGFNSDAVVITTNQFSFSTGFETAQIRVIPKDSLYHGGVLTWVDFWYPHNGDGSLAFSIQPAQSWSPTSDEYLLNTKSYGGNKVSLWRVYTGGASPSLTLQASLSVDAYTPPPAAEQIGDTAHVHSGDCRISGPVYYQNLRLYTAFSEKATWPGDGDRASIRWLVIQPSSNTVETDLSRWGASGQEYYYPAVTPDPHGNLALVFARSGPTAYVGLGYTGMAAHAAAPEPSAWLVMGQGPYEYRDGYGRNRWGDYFDAARDPADPWVLWIYGMYATNSNTWATYLGAVRFPANLVASDTLPNWDFPIVPRDSLNPASGGIHLSDTLPGNIPGTYINFSYTNEGPGASPAHTGQLYLDDEPLVGFVSGSLPPNVSGVGLEWGPYQIRGGRHTLSDSLDIHHEVLETDETDNFYQRQFVWSPKNLTANTPITRNAPPTRGSGAFPNCDGFRFVRPNYYAGVVALLPENSTDDYDLNVYTDYVGSDSGFSVLAKGSYYGQGLTDFVVMTWNVGEDTVYPAAVMYSAPTHTDFVLEADHSVGHLLTNNQNQATDTLSNGEILEIYECYLLANNTYHFSLEDDPGGTAGLYLYPQNAGYYNRSNFLRFSTSGFVYTPEVTGWYPLVVSKRFSSQLSQEIVFTVKMEYLPPGTWIGGASSDWHDTLNWVNHQVPDASMDVRIPGWAAHMPVISSATAYTHDLQVDSLASVELLNHQYLEIEGTLWINTGGTLVDTQGTAVTVHGNFWNFGTVVGPHYGYGISFYQDFHNEGSLEAPPNSGGFYIARGDRSHRFFTTTPLPVELVVQNNDTLVLATSLQAPSLLLYGTLRGERSGISVQISGDLRVFGNGMYQGDSLSTTTHALIIEENGAFTLQSSSADLTVLGSPYHGLELQGTLLVGGTFQPVILLQTDLYVGATGLFVPGHSEVRWVGSAHQTLLDTLGGELAFYDFTVNKPTGASVKIPRNADTLQILHNFQLQSGTFVLGSEEAPMKVEGDFLTTPEGTFHDTSGAQLQVYGTFDHQGTFVGPGLYQSIVFHGDFRNTGSFVQTGNMGTYLEARGSDAHTFTSTTALPLPLLVFRPVVLHEHSLTLPWITVYGYQGRFEADAHGLELYAHEIRVHSHGVFCGDSLQVHVDTKLEIQENGTFTLRSDQASLDLTGSASAPATLILNGVLDAGTSAPTLQLDGDLYVGASGTFHPGASVFTFVGSQNQTVYDTLSGNLVFHTLTVDKDAGILTFPPKRDTLVLLGDLQLQRGTLVLPVSRYTSSPRPDRIYGDVVLIQGTWDLADSRALALLVYGSWWESNTVVQEDHGLSPSFELYFLGPGEHALQQRAGNSLGFVAFTEGQGILQSDLTATALVLMDDGDLNTGGYDITLSRVLEFSGSNLSDFVQTAGTITCRGVNLQGSNLHLEGGTLRTSLDDPFFSNWNENILNHFHPAPDYTVEFVLNSNAWVSMCEGNSFGRLIVRQGTLDRGRSGFSASDSSPSRVVVDLSLNSSMVVQSDLRIGENVRVLLNGHALRIQGSTHADRALYVEGTLLGDDPGDTLWVTGEGANAVVASEGTLDLLAGDLFVNDTLWILGNSVVNAHYRSDSTNHHGYLWVASGASSQWVGSTLKINTGLRVDPGAFINLSNTQVHLYGADPATLTLSETSVHFHDLIIGDETHTKRVTVAGPAPLQVDGIFVLAPHDSLFLPDHHAFWCTGDSMTLYGYLDLGSSGSALHLGNGTVARVRAGGTLVAIGAPDAPDTITHADAGYYSLTFFSGSQLAAEFTTFEFMNTSGIRFFGNSLDPLHPLASCTFQNSAPGGRLLLLNIPTSVTIPHAHFPENTWSGYINVAKTIASGQVTFLDATGPFAGEAHEYDPYNTLFWQVSFLPGDANGDGSLNDLDLVFLANYLYHNGPAPSPLLSADNNHDCTVNQADLDYLANYLYHNGPAPSPCGTQPAVLSPAPIQEPLVNDKVRP